MLCSPSLPSSSHRTVHLVQTSSNGLKWGATAGREITFPSYASLPPLEKKEGPDDSCIPDLSFLPHEMLRGKSRNVYRLMLPLKILTEQNCLQDHNAEKQREERVGERNKTPSPLACHPPFSV